MKKFWLMTLVSMTSMAMSVTVLAKPMTAEQGDAILKELHEIKVLLAAPSKRQAELAAGQVVTRPIPSTAQPKQETFTVSAVSKFPLGKADAPITIVAFSDYQCGYCARFESDNFPKLKEKYIDTGKVRYIQRDLPFHPFALKAAQSAHCAGDQGKYWEMNNTLFKNSTMLDMAAVTSFAKGLNLNEDDFKKCMDGDDHLKEINGDSQYGQSLGINGTPSFIIGRTIDDSVEGIMFVGARPEPEFEATIDKMLQILSKN